MNYTKPLITTTLLFCIFSAFSHMYAESNIERLALVISQITGYVNNCVQEAAEQEGETPNLPILRKKIITTVKSSLVDKLLIYTQNIAPEARKQVQTLIRTCGTKLTENLEQIDDIHALALTTISIIAEHFTAPTKDLIVQEIEPEAEGEEVET